MTSHVSRALLLVLFAVGCGSTGPTRFDYAAIGVGQAALPIETTDYTVTLTAAKLAFGPAYFCQTAASSPELCPVAQAELLTVTLLDLLSMSEQPLGQVTSLAGVVGTVTYDLGWSWFPRDQAPRRASGVPHSAELAVDVVRHTDGAVRSFSVPIDLQPTIAGTRTVGATRVQATIEDDRWRLLIAGDARAWWQMVDPAELFALPNDTSVVPDDARPAKILRQQITSGRPLSFTWEPLP